MPVKIALLSIIKPQAGSGDGTTEYAYNLYKRIGKSRRTELLYALEHAHRVDILGLLYTNTLFRFKIADMVRHRYDVIHIASQETGFAAKIIKRVSPNTKIVTTVHDLARFESGMNEGVLQAIYSGIVRRSVTIASQYSDFFIFNSSRTRDAFINRFGIRNNFAVIPLGIRDKFVTRTLKSSRNKKAITVGYIGSFAHRKNLMLILKAAELLRNERRIKFTLYGTGADYDKLVLFKNMHELDNVEFKGFASERSIVKTYDSFDVFVFPSKQEGFGLPILEAQSRGIPTMVLSNSDIPSEVTKTCVKVSDAKELVDNIISIANGGYDPGKRHNAITHARQFTWGSVARKTIRIYDSLRGNSKSM